MDFRLIRHGIVDSTSERAFADLEQGRAQHGDVHLARGQLAGRGRQGRSWQSAPDEGLYASIVLLPGPPAYRPAALTMASALAVVEALNDLGLAPIGEKSPRLKWPNDVLVDGAKLCGILTESRGLDAQRPHFVLGIGLNVRQRHFPGELQAERPVTSLALLGLNLTVREATTALLDRLGRRLQQVRGHHRELAEDYLLASQLHEQRVLIACGQEELSGEVLGLSIQEGLRLRTDEGAERLVPLEFIRSVERDGGA